MKHVLTMLALQALALTAYAEADYRRVQMEIDIDKPAEEVWAAVGGYCDIGEWLNVDCEITSGDGGMGTVRALAGGRVTEIMVAATPLSYGYTQPVQEGRFYNLYHGFMEARPVDEESARLIYTLVYDVSNLEGEEAKAEDIARRRGMFETALQNMKQIAEGR